MCVREKREKEETTKLPIIRRRNKTHTEYTSLSFFLLFFITKIVGKFQILNSHTWNMYFVIFVTINKRERKSRQNHNCRVFHLSVIAPGHKVRTIIGWNVCDEHIVFYSLYLTAWTLCKDLFHDWGRITSSTNMIHWPKTVRTPKRLHFSFRQIKTSDFNGFNPFLYSLNLKSVSNNVF